MIYDKVIAVVNQKGGVAKTTSTVHLGVAIAETGKKVLLVDLDSQGHIAEAFTVVADELECDMSDVFEGRKRIADIIMPDVRANLDVAPNNVRLADMELTLVNMNFREVRLKRALEPVLTRADCKGHIPKLSSTFGYWPFIAYQQQQQTSNNIRERHR